MTSREDTLLEETLYEEDLLPVCSPALLAALGRPQDPADLEEWPLLYDLGWDADWAYWFTRQGQSTPDLSQASSFRLYSMLVQAAVHGIGAAVGRPMLIARELENRTLVPVFDRQRRRPNAAASSPRPPPGNGRRSRHSGSGSWKRPRPRPTAQRAVGDRRPWGRQPAGAQGASESQEPSRSA